MSPGRSLNGEILLCEVGFKDREVAIRDKKEFGNQRKERKVKEKLFVASSVTLATRVRLEILRAINYECLSAEEDFL